jgi:uncharacterized protein (UPF0210 family)
MRDAPSSSEIDPFAPLIKAAASLAGATEIVNRSAVATMELADLVAESESNLHQIKVGLLKIYVPIAERELMKHNDGVIPAEAALTLEKMRAFAAR